MRPLLTLFARIPIYVWILAAAAWGYSIHTDWEETQWQPLLSQIQSEQAKYKRLVSENSEAEKFKEQKEQKLRELNDLAKEFKKSSDEIPRDPAVPSLLKSLADISDNAGLIFAGFKPGAQLQEDFLVITPLQVTLKGSYPQVMSFLDAAANLKRVVATHSLQISKPTKRGTTAIIEANAVLHTYHVGESAVGTN